MKKLCCYILCTFMLLSLCSCGGNIEDAESYNVDSVLYTEEEIQSAIDTIKNEFEENWKGCTLTELYYAGDEKSEAYQDWADRNDADEAIVLLSSFDVAPTGADGSLNPDNTHDDWMWILVRTDGGKWIHVDHGY